MLTVLAALAIQVGTNYANDYYDARKGADTEARIGPRRAIVAAMALGAVAERLEQHARTHGVHAAAPFVAELTAEFARARAELTKLITP